VLQDFTDDKGKLIAAIDTLSVSLGDAVGKPEIADYRKQDLYGGGGYQGNANQWQREYQPYLVDKNWDPNEKIYNVTNFVDVLRTIGYALKDVPGRKTIIFLSPGFLGVNPVTSPWLFVNMGRVLERLSGYNITIYSVDVSGVATDQTGKRDERWDFLTYVSDKTGGKLFKNKNDLQGQLQRVNYEISHFYMLGYYSKDAYKDGRFVEVEVKCKRPGTKVRSVKGVYASRAWDKIPVEERKNNLHRLLDQSNHYVQIPIKVENTSAIPSENGAIIYPLAVRFPVFQFYKDYDYLSYDLYLLIKDAQNVQVDDYFQVIRIDKQNLVGKEFIVNFPLALKGGDYSIQLIVKNNISEELGSHIYKVKIPSEIKGFAGSEPKIFTGEQSATILFPESSGLLKSEAFFPHVAKHMVPATGKKLYLDEETLIHFCLVNYGMDVKKEQADVELEFAMMHEGKIITVPLDIKKMLDGIEKDVYTILIKIPPGTLEAGRYNLRIYCKDNASGQILTKQVPMTFTTRQKAKRAEKQANEG
jgi:VWFA-related protein